MTEPTLTFEDIKELREEDSANPLMLIAKGHHDAAAFLEAAREYLKWEYGDDYALPTDIGLVQYGWARNVPDPDHGYQFWPVGRKVHNSRGVYAYTAITDIELTEFVITLRKTPHDPL